MVKMVSRQHHSSLPALYRQAQIKRLKRICLMRFGSSTPQRGEKANGVYREMSYLVCYDLDKPGQDYTDVIAALQNLGARRIQLSVWLLSAPALTAVQIRDHLSQFIDGNDRLLVLGLQNVAAWQNL